MRPLASDPTGLLVRAEEPATTVRARIVAVPHAGAGPNSVASWTGLVPPGTEMIFARLPGRETRFAEVPLDDAVLAGARLAAAIAGLPPLPTILLGHSMGALVCYLAAPQVARLRGLIVSGLNPPHLPDLCPRISALNDGDFLNALRDLGGLPPGLAKHHEMLTLFLPVLRADFRLVEGYVHRDPPPLAVPLVAMAGSGDPLATPETARGWARHTASRFRVLPYAGDHFAITARGGSWQDTLCRALDFITAEPDATAPRPGRATSETLKPQGASSWL